MNACPYRPEIEIYCIESMPAEKRAELDAHLAICIECASVHSANIAFDELLVEECHCLTPSETWGTEVIRKVSLYQVPQFSTVRTRTQSIGWRTKIAVGTALAASVVLASLWISLHKQTSQIVAKQIGEHRNNDWENPREEMTVEGMVLPRAHDGFLAVRDDSSSNDIEIVWVLPVTKKISNVELSSK